jgi:protein-S-isoprenylcysteine O-methyltransferase Ste14
LPTRIWHLLPYVLFAAMMAAELYAGRRRRPNAKTYDRGSLAVVRLATLGGYLLGFACWEFGPAPRDHPLWPLVAGTMLASTGIAVRMWCVQLLGPFFTVDVRVAPQQQVITAGPYAILRHPSYAGGLMVAVGIGLAMGWCVTPLVIAIPQLAALIYRMKVEEAALLEGVGDPYRLYSERTKRLIPYLW